jgi:hypothetical protein
MLLAE